MSAVPSNAYEALIGALGTAALGDVLLRAAEQVSDIDEVFGFRVEGDEPPVQLASSGHRGSSLARAALYTQGFHMLDPLLPMFRQVRETSAILSASIVVGEIPRSNYRLECFERPGLAEKIAFMRRSGERRYVLNFYRRRHQRRVDSDQLASLAEIAMPILRRHGELLGDEAGLTLTERLERRLTRAYPLLTPRERQVCARTLTGMTAEATGLNLGLSHTSVLTYRRRAYARYGISSTGQLIGNLLG